ncbi:hypothetical protein BDR26DRAFT_862127 [Obelidium mucronatum]|nr:hypothetical protein BDR26DRAFT_862127 [Obelidium mucronatum]
MILPSSPNSLRSRLGPYTAAYISGSQDHQKEHPVIHMAPVLPSSQSRSHSSSPQPNHQNFNANHQSLPYHAPNSFKPTMQQIHEIPSLQKTLPMTDRPKLPSLGAMIDAHTARMKALETPTPNSMTPKSSSSTTPLFPGHHQLHMLPSTSSLSSSLSSSPATISNRSHRRTVSTPQNFGRSAPIRPMHQHSLSTSASPATVANLAAVMTGLSGSPSLYKPKFKFSEAQKQILLREFEVNQYPNHDKKEELGRLTGTTATQVQFWFQNTRQKMARKEGGAKPANWVTEFAAEGGSQGKRKREESN